MFEHTLLGDVSRMIQRSILGKQQKKENLRGLPFVSRRKA